MRESNYQRFTHQLSATLLQPYIARNFSSSASTEYSQLLDHWRVMATQLLIFASTKRPACLTLAPPIMLTLPHIRRLISLLPLLSTTTTTPRTPYEDYLIRMDGDFASMVLDGLARPSHSLIYPPHFTPQDFWQCLRWTCWLASGKWFSILHLHSHLFLLNHAIPRISPVFGCK